MVTQLHFRGLANGLLALLLTGALPPAMCVSCDDSDANQDRKEYIDVYSEPDGEESATVFPVGVQGGTATFYIRSNVEFTAKWQDNLTSPWIKIKNLEEIEPGLSKIELEVSKLSSIAYYTRRSGTLMLSAPELNYGKFITLNQGFTARVSCNFSWLKYGSADPRKDDGTLIGAWSQSQKDYGYTSTVIPGQDDAWCYGKNGFIMLGNKEGYGADFISPYTGDLRSDSLLVVTFKAVAYTSLDGVKDNNRLSFEVLDGGVIRDFAEEGGTRMEFEVPYYNMADENFPASMWDCGSEYMVFIASTPSNPISGDTRIRLTAGSLSSTPESVCNRIFIDNIYIRRFTPDDEDLFEANGGSGKDIILGTAPEDQQ